MSSAAKELYALLKERQFSVTTAESMTAGLISATLAEVPGMSDCLQEAYVTYAEEAKIRLLSVSEETLQRFTVYSREVAKEMAMGALRRAGADLALACTGIAGPDDIAEDKPAGLVYLAAALTDHCIVEEYHFKGSRNEVRRQACDQAILLGVAALKGSIV